MVRCTSVNLEIDVDHDDVVEVVDVSSDEDSAVRVSHPPRLFKDFRRGRELGSGASGHVYVCRRQGCTSGFAVKAVDLRRLQLSPYAEQERTWLEREVEILRSLPPHPRIVQMVDAFEEGSWFLMILELVGGGDLFTVMTSREPPRFLEREAAFIMRQLVDGIFFLHGQGVVHRDLKLENILIVSEKREWSLVLFSIKITDFGLSRKIGEGLAACQTLVGTKPYMAPEVSLGGSYSFSSDVWCLGVLLYVMLAGHFPFQEIPSHQGEVELLVQARVEETAMARNILLALLQINPELRVSLNFLCTHEWLEDDLQDDFAHASPARSPKRLRKAALDDTVTSEVKCEDGAVHNSNVSHTSGLASCVREQAEEEQIASKIASLPRHALAVEGESKEATSNAMAEPASSATADSLLMPPPAPVVRTIKAEASDTEGASSSSRLAAQGGRSLGEIPNVGASIENRVTPKLWQVCAPIGLGEWLKFLCQAEPDGMSVDMGLVVSIAPDELQKVLPTSVQPDMMQVCLFFQEYLARGKAGVQLKQIAATLGCKIRMVSHTAISDKLITIIGSYSQCVLAQEILHGRIMDAMRGNAKDCANHFEVVLWIRSEAAGVVVGKQGAVLDQIRKRSGATIQLLSEQVRGHRPCILKGILQSVLHAERHIFHLTRAVPLVIPAVEDFDLSLYSLPPACTPLPSPLNSP